MSVLLDVARIAAIANIGLLLLLGYVWGGTYRRHRASHTLGLLIFAGFLTIQNVLWLYVYILDEQSVRWFLQGDVAYQLSLTLLCGLQTIALLVLARITWR